MRQTANRRIAVKAEALDRQRRRKFAKVDMGGGSGRIGTRIQTISKGTKSDRLRGAGKED